MNQVLYKYIIYKIYNIHMYYLMYNFKILYNLSNTKKLQVYPKL